LFYTAPHAFEIAAQLSRTLLGCNPDWAVQLPREFLLRKLRQTNLAEALTGEAASALGCIAAEMDDETMMPSSTRRGPRS